MSDFNVPESRQKKHDEISEIDRTGHLTAASARQALRRGWFPCRERRETTFNGNYKHRAIPASVKKQL